MARDREKQKAYDREWKRKWRKANPEKWKAIQARHEAKVQSSEELKEKRRAYMRDWYARNPEKAAARRVRAKEKLSAWQKENYAKNGAVIRSKNNAKASLPKNRARRKELNQSYYAKNKEAIKAHVRLESKRKYDADPEAARARKKAWAKANPEKERARIQRRRALVLGNKSTGVTPEEWTNICAHHDWRCAYCFAKRKLTRDHVLALSRGGRDEPSNVVPACRRCNSSKSSKELRVWLDLPILFAPSSSPRPPVP